ncbi:hypothetical protein [Faecalibacterium sp. An121]|uniref:hypothetical protein n=1 Tax=Faecalibacterium sp. An121 TaxID=1965550 RepID=UPI000B375477|nr:hypothetical protein [Faecalibacterium sp. An121]OUQ35334.1 hypothetical protein B5E66_11520 [Faecalibacterium sp. An121]
MKLKKIASLALAGIMAVSMLAGCNGSTGNEQPPASSSEPTTSGFATSVNAELASNVYNTVHFGSDAKLTAALNSIAEKLDSNILNDEAGFVIGVDAQDFRSLMDVNVNNSLTRWGYANGSAYGFADPTTTNYGAYKNGTGAYYWDFFKNDTTSTTTVGDLVVIRGDLTQTGLAKRVAQYLSQLVNNGRMPSEDNDGSHKYDYTGNIDVVKVDNAGSNFSSYVIGFTITQTATPIANGNG